MVRMRSGMANASSRGRTSTRTSRAVRQLRVDGRLDRVDEVAGHRLELEVHAPRARFHVAAGHERAVVAPDHAAQGVQRGVGAHQGQATRPVQVDLQRVADGRRVAVGRLQLVDDLAVDLARARDRPGPAIRGAQEQPAIGRLAAPARVEHRAVQDDAAWPRPPRRGGPSPSACRA